MHRFFLIVLLAVCGVAQAETPRQIADAYALAQGGGFKAAATRGAEFFANKFGVSAKMPSCSACHTSSPAQEGQHVVTGKTIKPLAPVANAERLSDPAKVEKWFTRNCKEVVGRECTPGEKADFITFLMEAR
jgi:cytochrome c553